MDKKRNIPEESARRALQTAFVAKNNQQIPEQILKTIVNFLTNKTDNIQLRIACANILSKEIEQNCNCFKILRLHIVSLQVVALESRNNKNEDLLNKFVFQILEKFVQEKDLSQRFFVDYSVKLKERAISLEENLTAQDFLKQLSPSDKDIQTEKDSLKKYHLLNTLNNSLVNCQYIDTTIFNQFDSNEWEKEILCSELLTETFKLNSQNNEGINEFELEKFRKNINLLKINQNKNVLKILIDKQNIYQFDLEFINDILLMLSELDESRIIKALNILEKKDDSLFLELQKLWLTKRLEHFNIKFNEKNLKILNSYLIFKCEIINQILSKIKENTKIEELIEFFVILENCGLTQNTCENFLVNEIVHKTSIKNWKLKLNDRLVGIILTNKYPIYNNYLKNTNNYKLAISKNVVFTKNAYNQANTTYSYNANDIVQISSEWMKNFINSFRITQAIDQQVDTSLHDILTNILNDCKKDQTSTIIPLNIADNHWITLVIIHHENKNIVLYKDSLGKDNFVEKRKEVQKILAEKFENIIFKFHKSCDQLDCYNSGVFVLANMKIIVEQLRNNEKYFIKNFEMNNFIIEKEVMELRQETFPKMYALNVYQLYKRKKVVSHHSVELKLLQKLLEKNNDIVNHSIVIGKENKLEKNGLRLSIELPEDENLVKENYQYLYVIEASKGLRTKIIAVLDIKEIYSVEENVVKILDQKLTALSKIQQKKLDQSELTIKTSDSELERLLDELSVDSNDFSKDILRKHLNLIQEKKKDDSSSININVCELLNNLHKKLTTILTCDWSIESIRELILYPIYEYNLKKYDCNIKGNNLFDILRLCSSKNWTKEIHDLAIFQIYKGSYDKNLEQLITEIFELNKQQKISILQNQELITEYGNVENCYNNKSTICPEFDIIKKWTASEMNEWAKKVKPIENVSQY
ncbi:unnamed protein product [Didymodactylos carnosus]|uniref:Ubiquitin-like protease family profile domain-containing protein n=1 Tax=Didymodactylos carnosus TaxID=1234261 RepID=A0A815GZJ0_9BILA|nr:unnamed protein product [Didymodactylos carnosus]CAF4210498.1 unnamed protein product [Didymodactylos carnosus]